MESTFDIAYNQAYQIVIGLMFAGAVLFVAHRAFASDSGKGSRVRQSGASEPSSQAGEEERKESIGSSTLMPPEGRHIDRAE